VFASGMSTNGENGADERNFHWYDRFGPDATTKYEVEAGSV